MNFKDSKYLVEIFDFKVLHLELNTPLFVLALVLIVMICLHFLLFKPVLRTLDRRRAHLEELADNTARHRDEVAGLAGEYEQKLNTVRAEVARVRLDSRKETQEAVEAILYKARQEADAELRQALSQLESEVAQAKGNIAESARNLAEKTANRIVAA